MHDFLLTVPRGLGAVLLPLVLGPRGVTLRISRVVNPDHLYSRFGATSRKSFDVVHRACWLHDRGPHCCCRRPVVRMSARSRGRTSPAVAAIRVLAKSRFGPTPHIFFLMIPPPPRSTLFPYTTLFRSRPARVRRT